MAGKTRLPTILAVAAILAGSAAAAPVAARASFEGESGRIAFVRYYPAGPAIVTINPDGSDAELLTQPASGTWVGRPEWSPGGTMIAFAKGASAQTADIWVMNDDGTKARRLTTHPAADITPAWAADPARIAFASNRSGDYEIYDMKTDGSDVRRLTRQTGSDHSPVFGPNLGGGIQFVSNHRTGTSQTDLYGMAQNGTNLHRWKTAEPGQSLRSPDTGFSRSTRSSCRRPGSDCRSVPRRLFRRRGVRRARPGIRPGTHARR